MTCDVSCVADVTFLSQLPPEDARDMSTFNKVRAFCNVMVYMSCDASNVMFCILCDA